MKRISVLSLLMVVLTLVGCGKKQEKQNEECCSAHQYICVHTTPTCPHGDVCYMTYDVFKGLAFSCSDCENIVEKNIEDIATGIDIPVLLDLAFDNIKAMFKVTDKELRFNYLGQVTNPNVTKLMINTLVTLEDGTEVENAILFEIPMQEDGSLRTDSLQLIMGDLTQGAESRGFFDYETLKFSAPSLLLLTIKPERWSPIKMFWKPIIAAATTVKEIEEGCSHSCGHESCQSGEAGCNHECDHEHEAGEHQCDHEHGTCDHQCNHEHEGTEHQCNHEGCGHH